MAEFQCIGCGEIVESENECSCPQCGYRMFQRPYDRGEVLKQQIQLFIRKLETPEFRPEDFQYSRSEMSESGEEQRITKEMDDARFPELKKIVSYICSGKTAEEFFRRMDQSIETFRGYLQAPYTQEYRVSLEGLKDHFHRLDRAMLGALGALKVRETIPEMELPKIEKAVYFEEPNEEFLSDTEKILDSMLELSGKIRTFIKRNQIYGSDYREKPRKAFPHSGDTGKDLAKIQRKLDKVLKKQYIVDVFEDGAPELNEMLTALWQAFEVVRTTPLRRGSYLYTMEDGEQVSDLEISGALRDHWTQRYQAIDAVVFSREFLEGYSEEKRFDLYDQMVDLDSFGFLGFSQNCMRVGKSEAKLNRLIGLDSVKDSVRKIKAYALSNPYKPNLNLNMCFLGNPGTGKTEVARLIAGILHENGILPTDHVIEVDRSGLVSPYFGATADKTSRVIDSALGGVLFVDEAYALGNNAEAGTTDYGREAIDTLVKAMEDYRGKICVIFAGYQNEMEKMLSLNPGLKSRVQFTLIFENYSRENLREIAKSMLETRNYKANEAALNRILDITDVKRKEPNFANAREIRNILDQTIMCQNLRTGGRDREIGVADVNQYIKDSHIRLPLDSGEIRSKICTGEEELEALVGLPAVKRMVKKIKAYAKRNKAEPDFNLHMCFSGNPGTGKTEVARILSRILYDAGVLNEAKLVETDARGLLGRFAGETAPKTQEKIEEAMGGVLFIDEAYGLIQENGGNNSGREAIAILLKEMEDRRGQFCVIMAGYSGEMKEVLDINPGLKSRIQFTLDFPDYTREELGQIAQVFAEKKKYILEPTALEKLLDVTEYYRGQPDFANARTVRNILDQVIMNQNLRTDDEEDPDNTIQPEDVAAYIEDEGIDLAKKQNKSGSIGLL